MDYEFSKLTHNEQCLLTFCGWHVGSPWVKQPTKKSAAKLLERGLVAEIKRTERGFSWSEFTVPLDVHMAWCCQAEG